MTTVPAPKPRFALSAWDRFTLSLAPEWTIRRLRARAAAGIFASAEWKAASGGHRTASWNHSRGDVNAVNRFALEPLRTSARDLCRNNGWARRARRIIANNVVRWGVMPKATGVSATTNARADELWSKWSNATTAEVEGRQTFNMILRSAVKAMVTDGEVLLRRRWRSANDGLPLPFQVQVLEADYLDHTKDGIKGVAGGPIIQGVEYDGIGRRVAYWIYPSHPGSALLRPVESRRIPASEIVHLFLSDRLGQVRGVSWFGAAIVKLHDFDEYEDAEMMQKKIAACFAAFVEDDGSGANDAIGTESEEDPSVDFLEPGMIKMLRPGQKVTTATPPTSSDSMFATRLLRRVAASLDVTYEELSGDYTAVNFSSARMGRIGFQSSVEEWQYDLLIPLCCNPMWQWAMEAAVLTGEIAEVPPAAWTATPLPMLEPDKEGLALVRLVRSGALTPSAMVRQLGEDPTQHFAEYAADLALLDKLGIKLDSDVRAVSQAGLTQERVGAGGQKQKADDENADPS